jgi:biopolymer transport protein TolR
MAMLLDPNRRHGAEINITPMIDILLVLLIIFMVIVPTKSTGLDAILPQPAGTVQTPPAHDLEITVLGNEMVRLNQESLAVSQLGERLTALLKNAPIHVVFIRGRGDLDFQQIAEVIDIARGVGLNRVGLLTD